MIMKTHKEVNSSQTMITLREPLGKFLESLDKPPFLDYVTASTETNFPDRNIERSAQKMLSS